MNAPTRAEAEAGIDAFAAEDDAKYPKAVAPLRRDQARLLTFYCSSSACFAADRSSCDCLMAIEI